MSAAAKQTRQGLIEKFPSLRTPAPRGEGGRPAPA